MLLQQHKEIAGRFKVNLAYMNIVRLNMFLTTILYAGGYDNDKLSGVQK